MQSVRDTNPSRESSRRAAFTLIEIMAVVIIIGLLTTIVGAAIFQQVDKGRVTTARAQINSLEGVLELYRMDNGRFPSTEQGLEALVVAPTGDPPAPRIAGGWSSPATTPRPRRRSRVCSTSLGSMRWMRAR